MLGIAEDSKTTAAKTTGGSNIIHGKCAFLTSISSSARSSTTFYQRQILFSFLRSNIPTKQYPRCQLQTNTKIVEE